MSTPRPSRRSSSSPSLACTALSRSARRMGTRAAPSMSGTTVAAPPSAYLEDDPHSLTLLISRLEGDLRTLQEGHAASRRDRQWDAVVEGGARYEWWLSHEEGIRAKEEAEVTSLSRQIEEARLKLTAIRREKECTAKRDFVQGDKVRFLRPHPLPASPFSCLFSAGQRRFRPFPRSRLPQPCDHRCRARRSHRTLRLLHLLSPSRRSVQSACNSPPFFDFSLFRFF